MKSFLLKLFTWWNGQTFGTQWWTWLHGEFVGEDEFGNHYYRTRGGKIDTTLGFERRWVIYNGYTEASTIPPSWHGWMHHTVDTPPTERATSRAPGRSRTAPTSPARREAIVQRAQRWRKIAAPKRPAITRHGRIRTARRQGRPALSPPYSPC